MRMEENAFLTVGEVVGTHGVKGTLKVYSFADSADIFAAKGSIQLQTRQGELQRFTVRWVKPHKNILLVSLKEISRCEAAEMLIGSVILIPKADLPELEDDEFYWHELLGLSVYDENRGYLGTISSIIQTGSNDVYIVKDADREVLVPALASVVTEINPEDGRMMVRLPDGL